MHEVDVDIKQNWHAAKLFLKAVAYTIVVFCTLLSSFLYIKMHNEIMGGYTALYTKLKADLGQIAETAIDKKVGTILKQARDSLKLQYVEDRNEEQKK